MIKKKYLYPMNYHLHKSTLLVVTLFMIYISTSNGCIQEEKNGLLGLKQLLESNGADSSKYLPDWVDNSNKDCCDWERVTCHPTTGKVTELFLWNLKDIHSIHSIYEEDGMTNDVWSINCSLFLPFSDLKSLNLSYNSFDRWDKNHGFEKLSALKKLEIIDLSSNNFEDNTIYHYLGAITSLKTLILGYNGFSGSFPAHELVGLDNLEILDLSYCGYGEWLPKQGFEKLTVFKKLETLNLCYNAFTVEVLPYLNSITSLKVLNLRANRFGGSFPAQELGNLTKLESLDLSDNSLTGTQGFESLGKFKNLTSLDVSFNMFNRTLFQSLSPLTSLKNLFLAVNNMGDPFPATELTVFGNLEMLDLSSNNLGSLTVKDCELLSKLKKMRHIDLSFNVFKKSVLRILDAIPSLRFLSLESNYMEGPISNQDLTCNRSSLEVLLLNDNKLNGSLPVKGLASLRFLEVLNLANNFFSGGIPSSIGAFSSLKVLSLASNQLNGSLPDQDLTCNRSSLEVLLLNDNFLNGSLPVKGLASLRFLEVLNLEYNFNCELLSKLKKMRHIDLSGNVFEKSVLRILDAIPSLRFLSLERNYMEGPISNQDLTYNRSSLEVLLLNHNKLNGSLPVKGLASLRFLEVLDLKNNFFSGGIPSSIGAFSSLKVLSLASNQLNGSLPDQGLCELTELEELDLSNNLLQGTLPPCLSNLKSLRVFNIAVNRFTGNLSSSLVSSLISLEYIDLSHNLFEGTFSFSSLANHSNLVVFKIISDNSKLEVETEDTEWLPMFQLKALVLSNCNLNKLSGNKLPKFLLHQTKLIEVDLSKNNLDDLFPNWLLVNNTRLDVFIVAKNSLFGAFHLPSVHNTADLDFSDNNLNGKVQANIGNVLPFIFYLNLSKNAFEGDIPSSFGVMRNLNTLDLSSNTFSGEAPMHSFGNCTWLSSLLLSNNSLHGQIFTDDFNLTSVRILQLADNQFTGPLATSVLSSDLMYLDVSNNSFSGPISCANQNLNSLKYLHLQGNNFTGLIPQSFLNSSVLLTLDVSDNRFSGTIPMFLTPFPELRILLSRGNLLNGSIPSHLCRLNKINLIDLSNNFFTGSIPRCLSNFAFGLIEGYRLGFTEEYPIRTGYILASYYYQGILMYRFKNHVESITYSKREEVNFVTKSRSYSYQGNILNIMYGMDLSGNKLTGEIPTEIGDLISIRALNLSHNRLTGPIPKSLANLKQVESLDLSYNVLSGNIPMELTDLDSLSVFSVAHNNLSGTIPYGKPHFQTFDVSSYEGNPGLCGSPLEKSCNIVDTRETPTDGSDESDEDWLVYSAIFGGAFFTSLVGTLIVFCLNPNWRKWLFDPVDRVLDSCYLRFVNSRKKQRR